MAKFVQFYISELDANLAKGIDPRPRYEDVIRYDAGPATDRTYWINTESAGFIVGKYEDKFSKGYFYDQPLNTGLKSYQTVFYMVKEYNMKDYDYKRSLAEGTPGTSIVVLDTSKFTKDDKDTRPKRSANHRWFNSPNDIEDVVRGTRSWNDVPKDRPDSYECRGGMLYSGYKYLRCVVVDEHFIADHGVHPSKYKHNLLKKYMNGTLDSTSVRPRKPRHVNINANIVKKVSVTVDVNAVKNFTATAGKDVPVGTIMWKKVVDPNGGPARIVKMVTLEPGIVPHGCAMPCGNKFRVPTVRVLSIRSLDDKKGFKQGVSFHDPRFIYRVGAVLTVENFNNDKHHDCAAGIHGFATRNEAEQYR